MIRVPWKHLTFWDFARRVNPISSLVLDEAMLRRAIILLLAYQPQRSWVQGCPEMAASCLNACEELSKAIVEVLL